VVSASALPVGGDISDHLDANPGIGHSELVQLLKDTPPWEPEPSETKGGPGPITIPAITNAAVLQRRTFTEPRWAVPHLLPEGVSVLAGAPKLGKSWLALDVALSVPLGGMALGKLKVEPGLCLYLALEDTDRRLQQRLDTLMPNGDAPEGLHIATTWPTLPEGGMAHLRQWLTDHPDARLVVIDTLAKIRGPVFGMQNQYAADYEAISQIKKISDEFGIAFLVIHHTRKMAAEDPLDMVSGTNGITGAADTILVLRREIGRHDATLYVRGRDVAEADHALAFDPVSCAWTFLGDADTYRMSQERADIVKLLADAPEPLRPKEIAEALGKNGGAVRRLLSSMTKAGTIVGLGGSYTLPPNTAQPILETTPPQAVIPIPLRPNEEVF
jgi:hypothetical protein